MDSIYNNLYNTEDIHVLVTADDDDDSMFDRNIITKIEGYRNAHVIFGRSKSKIDAVNRDMNILPDRMADWDIVVVMSDDMRFTFFGWDEIVRQQFSDHLDSLIHLPDNDAKDALATMYIAGRLFYERFKYIYNPIYKSLFCDNEIMEIAKQLDRYKYVDCPGVIMHLNPAYGHGKKDALFEKQQEIGWSVDQDTFIKRQAINFGL